MFSCVYASSARTGGSLDARFKFHNAGAPFAGEVVAGLTTFRDGLLRHRGAWMLGKAGFPLCCQSFVATARRRRRLYCYGGYGRIFAAVAIGCAILADGVYRV